MRNAVTTRVSHLIFNRFFFDMFPFEGECSLEIMLLGFMAKHELYAFDVSFQVIACMQEVGSNAEIFACFRLREPILSLNVVLFLLLCRECWCQYGDRSAVGDVAPNAQCSEICSEKVFLLSVEIDAEWLYILQCAELSFTVFRFKVVVVVGNVAYKIDRPSPVGFIIKIGLVI